MKQRLGACLAGLVLAFSGSAFGQTSAACDRTCLRGVLDSYLTAVIRHDPAAAPLAANHRATENAATVKAGDGIWKTATSLGEVQRRFFDPTGGQAAYFGHLKEGETEDVVSVRIKVVDRKVAEAEWTIARPSGTGMFGAAELKENQPPPEEPLPARDRTSRFHMVALGNGYFQGLQDHDGEMIPHLESCERVENGVRVTHRPRRAPATTAPARGGAAPTQAQEEISGDCVAGFEAFRASIAETTLRRFPLVDEEQGVVMGTTIFRRPSTSTMRRNLLTEYFYVRGGKLAGIWAAMYYLPPEAPHSSGWD